MGQFRLEWADFSGGHWVGGESADQPHNTYTGWDAAVAPTDGMLFPAPAMQLGTDLTSIIANNVAICGAAKAVTYFQSVPANDLFDVVMIPWRDNGLLKVTLAGGTPGGMTQMTQSAQAGSNLATNGWTSRPIPFPTTTRYVDKFAIAAYFGGATRPNFTGVAGVGNYLVVADPTAAASPFLTCTALPETMGVLCVWGERMYGASQTNPGRLFYSARGNFTSWSASNFIDIGGGAGSPLTALVATANALYIGRADGWWTLTGVPGDSAYVRQMDVPLGPLSDHVAQSPYGVLFERPDKGVILMAQRGHQQYPTLRGYPRLRDVGLSSGEHCAGPVSVSPGVVVAGESRTGDYDGGANTWTNGASAYSATLTSFLDRAWVLEGSVWRRITQPVVRDNTADGNLAYWAQGRSLASSHYAWLVTSRSRGSGGAFLKVWAMETNPIDCGSTDSSCTVNLAEMRRGGAGSGPLTGSVREVIAEVDVGALGATGYDPSLDVQVQIRGRLGDSVGVDGALSPIAHWEAARALFPQAPDSSSPTWLGGEIERQRQIVRMPLASTPGQSFQPIVTLRNCRLRRLILVCEDGQTP